MQPVLLHRAQGALSLKNESLSYSPRSSHTPHSWHKSKISPLQDVATLFRIQVLSVKMKNNSIRVGPGCVESFRTYYGTFMEALIARLDHLEHWQIALLATSLLYQGIFLAVFPEEVIITTLGLLWSQNRINFFEAWIAICVGLLPANATTVYVGSRLGIKILKVRPFSWLLKKESIDESLEQIRYYGKRIVFFTRFMPMIRGPIYFAAGMSKMGVLNFMKTDFAASLIQVPGLLFLGCAIGKNATSIMDAYSKIGMLMLILLTAAVLIKWAMHQRSHRVLMKLKKSRLFSRSKAKSLRVHSEK
jgi:membrane protein DedA with SNARE-associated domain